MPKSLKICLVGSGAISTAFAQVLGKKEQHTIDILSIEEEVIYSINQHHVNHKYFPTIPLNENIRATADKEILKESDVIFFGIPSTAIIDYVTENKKFINPDALLVNLAKGFGNQNNTIPQNLERIVNQPVISLKGPSFAREIINLVPTGMTVASKNSKYFDFFKDLFQDTNIFLDFTNDVVGVELSSILKNIYAIIIGIVDAHYDSPNLRSLVLTRSINEMRYLLSRFGGKEKTIFNYCGFGDFSLTALNDMSRNRTLGLLIGKGFFTEYISEKVVLEGKIATNVFVEKIATKRNIRTQDLMMKELYRVFNEKDYDISNFVKNILAAKPIKEDLFTWF
ncbi:glycerol-3-phosphate dehydrogenase [Candidatus Sulfidibacterium hydrothermale]|uniref:NAD(P)H-dependent glycerol-3-phosphate dehydrogenase n=1 Tax=Candidatus Sulfidibacterium hydrothermale TaxID=2875962 RepID=UPI001F0AA59E|nr:NAD(P)H-dependent glycerol-3-phosphate dehydrogenase [Candidatus Sulfidibacterium hydrothermale]UBM61663.1 glycerol-3-phosphate dehydrogenase [Candidatus Sulfidibacterium hydrothermale]